MGHAGFEELDSVLDEFLQVSDRPSDCRVTAE